MTIHPCYIGCDVSKRVLDFFDPATNTIRRIANTPESIAQLASELAWRDVVVVLEATGGYDRHLRHGLSEAEINYVRVNPTRARRFAQAAGFLAKTDAIDARMLSRLGETMKLVPDTPDDRDRQVLDSLQRRRDQLVLDRADEKKRIEASDDAVVASIGRHIVWLEGEIADIDARIDAFIAQHQALKQTRTLLLSAPGVGAITANVLIAQMAELGCLSPKKIAALAGLAPVNHDSGALRGQRHIAGGRRRVRQALYMAALSATRTQGRLRDFYQRIQQRAKSNKVAIIAVARKLLTILNAMLRDNTAWAN